MEIDRRLATADIRSSTSGMFLLYYLVETLRIQPAYLDYVSAYWVFAAIPIVWGCTAGSHSKSIFAGAMRSIALFFNVGIICFIVMKFPDDDTISGALMISGSFHVLYFYREIIRVWDEFKDNRSVRSVVYLAIGIVPFAFASLYSATSLSTDCFSDEVKPVETLYFSYVTLTTLGYGDIVPLGMCRVVAMTEAVVGYIMLGMGVVAIGAHINPEKPE
jgi:hypothetical protein